MLNKLFRFHKETKWEIVKEEKIHEMEKALDYRFF